MSYYHKYRPKNLEELIGQPHVVDLLRASFAKGRLSHAYLFCGPRGTGKTSTARILAKMVNCQAISKGDKKSQIPCNTCSNCLSIQDGSFLDLVEIDAASNRSIDDIRSLRENIKLSPSQGFKKVYIIDEVHMLSTEAFNALLKTLEEPPSHVVFILATTEERKIPQTILSRVTKLDFRLAQTEEVKLSVKRIIEGESLEIDEAALDAIAALADGSYRDAQKLLDQLSSTGEKVTLSMVEEILQQTSIDNAVNFISALIQKDGKTAFAIIDQIASTSQNFKDFTQSCLMLLRNLILFKSTASASMEKDYSPMQAEKLNTVSAQASLEELLSLAVSLQEALVKAKLTNLAQISLELSIIPYLSTTHKINEKQLQQTTPIEDHPTPSTPTSDSAGAEVSDHILTLQDKWQYILETIKPQNFSLQALLRTVKLLKSENNTLVLEVPYAFHKRQIESNPNLVLLESVFSEVLGTPVRITTIVGQRPQLNSDIQNIDLASDDEIIKVASEIFNSDTAIS